jgi:16S rRNA (uracil1498-N3)-methyltransferase
MRIPRIYTPQALSPQQDLILEDDAAHHIARVLRMAAGAELALFNGDGNEYAARIFSVDKKQVVIAIERAAIAERESPLHIHLGIAISKGERMDWIIQKATELGVSQITPLISERVEVRLQGEREEKRLAHWRGVVIAACEQCLRNRLPLVDNVTSFSKWIADVRADAKFVLHHRSATALDARHEKPKDVALLIGPEGGLSDSEIALAERYAFAGLRLGPRVLRTETAPLAALSVLQYLWGDLR